MFQGEKLAIAGLFGDGGAMGVCIDRTCSPARMYGMTELQLNRYTIHLCDKFCFNSNQLHTNALILVSAPRMC